MSLDYRPFSDTPAIHALADDLAMNLSDRERLASAVAGVVFASTGIAQRGLARWLLLTTGGFLFRRGITGYCPLSDRLERDSRHPRSGVRGNRGIRVEESIEIRCDADALYDFWKQLETLPYISPHVVEVLKLGPRRSHWTLSGPAGTKLEWDAEIINDHDGRLIAWKSLAGASIPNAGSIRFEPLVGGGTKVKVAFEYDPPAGELGAFVSHLFGASPESWLKRDLETFRQFAEKELGAAPKTA